MRFRLMNLILAGLLAAIGPSGSWAGWSEEAVKEDGTDVYYRKLREIDAANLAARNAGYKAIEEKKKEWAAAREKANQPQTAEVIVDDQKITVTEPTTVEEALGFKGDRRVRDLYEFSPDDYEVAVRDRWAINISDFKFDRPRYITADMTPGSSKTWFGFTFSITNSSTKPRRISPVFTAITNKGAFNVSSGGFLPERMFADTMERPLGGSLRLEDKELASQNIAPLESVVEMLTGGPEKTPGNLKPGYTFEPGQTRWGAAVWSEFNNDFTELKIAVQGLTNSHKYDEKMQRVLVLSFERNSDGFNVNQSYLKYTGKKWEYSWIWDQDITVPVPAEAKDPQIKIQQLKTPAGFERYVWAFPFEIKNSTRVNQEISIMSVSFVCPVEVDVGGIKVPVEVRVVDEGTSSIYKAAMLKDLGAEMVKNRFQNKALIDGSKTQVERNRIMIETGKAADKNWAIFDQNDVDWSNAIDQIEGFLSRGQDKAALSKQYWENAVKTAAKDNPKLLEKNPGYLYNPRRALNDDELKSVKEQILKAIPDAVEKAKTKKTVIAYFNSVSGMSTGEFRVSRSYRKPGVVEEDWLKGWEDSEKKP